MRLHKRYERRGLAIFRKRLRQAANKIPFDNLTESTYSISVSFNVGLEAIQDAYIDLHSEIGVTHGKRVGKELNKEISKKNFEAETFESGYRDFISRWLLQNGGQRITSVREELVEYLVKFIADRIEQGQDIRTIARDLQKHILSRGFYRWQIERIVRTETTAAANQGAIRAGDSSNVIWEKVWISSRDARTRRRPDDQFDHFEMDGVRADKGEKFNVQGDLLDYPGDPNGHPANVINCRCTVAVRAKRDENGRIVFRDRQAVLS